MHVDDLVAPACAVALAWWLVERWRTRRALLRFWREHQHCREAAALPERKG